MVQVELRGLDVLNNSCGHEHVARFSFVSQGKEIGKIEVMTAHTSDDLKKIFERAQENLVTPVRNPG